jgi:hypothetical protein
MDEDDMEEVGKPLKNDSEVVDLLHILEVENKSSVHIYVEYKIDEAVMVDQDFLFPPLDPHPDGPNDDTIVGDGDDIP